MSIGERMRDLRKAQGLSQQRLAQQAGLSLSLVSGIEQGRISDLHLSTLEGVSRALSVSIAELVEEPAPRPKASASPSPSEEVSDEERRFPDRGEDEADQFLLDMFELVRRKAQAAIADWCSRSDALTSVEAGYSAGSACYREAVRIIELTAEVIQKFGDDVSPQTVKAVQLMRDALLDDLRQAAEYVHDRVVWLERNEAEAYEAFGPEAPLYYSEYYFGAQESEHPVDELAQRRQRRAELKELEERDSGHVLEQIAAEHGT